MPAGPRLVRRIVEEGDAGGLAVDFAGIIAPVRGPTPARLLAFFPFGVRNSALRIQLALVADPQLVVDPDGEGSFFRYFTATPA